MQFPNASYDPELLKLMTSALDAAWGDRSSPHGIDDEALRTAFK
jgi:hypothetical protein